MLLQKLIHFCFEFVMESLAVFLIVTIHSASKDLQKFLYAANFSLEYAYIVANGLFPYLFFEFLTNQFAGEFWVEVHGLTGLRKEYEIDRFVSLLEVYPLKGEMQGRSVTAISAYSCFLDIVGNWALRPVTGQRPPTREEQGPNILCGLDDMYLIFCTPFYYQMLRILSKRLCALTATKFTRSFSTSNIPELNYADQLSRANRLIEAAQNYQGVMTILQSSNKSQEELDHVNAKLIGCHFLTRKYADVVQLISESYIKAQGLVIDEQGFNNYLLFCYICAHCQMKLPIQPIDHPYFKDLVAICSTLLGSAEENSQQPNLQGNSFDVLARIATNLNHRIDYRSALISLIERDNKKLRKNEAGEEISLFMCPHSESELLYLMGLTLNQKYETVAEKTFSNQRINEILKSYEENRQNQVYKPLIGLLISLITEKHYMAAEGMLGHIKCGESGLFCGGVQGVPVLKNSQDHNLVENIYRMLVTRANHQSFEEGWSRQIPVNLGLLVAERLAAAPLNGHATTNLI